MTGLACVADADHRRVFVSAKPGYAMLLAICIASPNITRNVANEFVSYRHTVSNMNLNDDLPYPIKVLEFLGSQFGIFGPILFAIFVIVGWATLRADHPLSPGYKFLLAYSAPMILIISGQAPLWRANANWAATSYVAATVLVCAWCLQLNKAKWLQASSALNIALAVFLYSYNGLADTFGVTLTRKTDPMLQARGWGRAGPWPSKLQAQFSAYPGHNITLNAFLLRRFRGYSEEPSLPDRTPSPE